jgi:hypothetical protein
MQFGQNPEQTTHEGTFCTMRGWLDEYAAWRDTPAQGGLYADECAPFEHAQYREWNEG